VDVDDRATLDDLERRRKPRGGAPTTAVGASCAAASAAAAAGVPPLAADVDPLALLLPTSVVLERDAAPFHPSLLLHDDPDGLLLGGDDHPRDGGTGTGLRHDARHAWVWHSALGVGDALLWRSELVYHAAFARPGQQANASRRSADVRLMRRTHGTHGATHGQISSSCGRDDRGGDLGHDLGKKNSGAHTEQPRT
jgi:hypothetical protein